MEDKTEWFTITHSKGYMRVSQHILFSLTQRDFKKVTSVADRETKDELKRLIEERITNEKEFTRDDIKTLSEKELLRYNKEFNRKYSSEIQRKYEAIKKAKNIGYNPEEFEKCLAEVRKYEKIVDSAWDKFIKGILKRKNKDLNRLRAYIRILEREWLDEDFFKSC